MRVQHLTLEQFRNIKQAHVVPSPDINIIYGDNAQGKTNLLEALWLCTGAKSFRGAKMPQFIAFDQAYGSVVNQFEAFGRQQQIELRFGRLEKQLLAKRNGVGQKSVSALAGYFCAVVFAPDHLDLVTGGPEGRRRLTDSALGQLKPHYIDLLSRYQKSLYQRNSLLRTVGNKYSSSQQETLAVWNESLVGFGVSIMDYRQKYLLMLSELAKNYYRDISGGREVLDILYYPSIKMPAGAFAIKEMSNIYRDRLNAALEEDLRAGFTTLGVHRDDVQIRVGGRPARTYASQGQKRSCVLAMKLAESDIVRDAIGEEPIIFLDDIMSELDEKRQSFVREHIRGKQVFITCCDKTVLKHPENGKVFSIASGQVQAEL